MNELSTTRISFVNKLAIAAIETVWQRRLSKRYAKKMNCLCRFYPSCSEFAKLSLARHGFFKAVSMSYGRVRRCTLDNTDTCIDFP